MNISLPKNWSFLPLREVVDKKRPITYGIVQAGPNIENGIPYIRVSDMTKGRLSLDGMLRTSDEIAKKYKRSTVVTNDIVFALRGIAGAVVKVPAEVSGANLTQGTARIAPSEKVTTDFLIYAISSGLVQKDIGKRLKGSTFKEISLGELEKVHVPIPTLPEQRKIAEILSTWDEAIAKTERLITALRARKKGLMQRLLSGQVRFAGFEDEWKKVHLRDVFQRITRKVGDKKNEYVLSITATVGFVDQREKFGRVIAGKNLENYVLLQKDEFAYNKGNSNSYPQGCIYLLEEFDKGAVPNVYFSFSAKSKKQVNNHFYKHYFESSALNPQLEKYISSSVRGDGLFNIAFDDFFSVKIPLPPIEEQEKIATVLDACDEEIKLQVRKLAALKQQKKGLMQRLLTGKIRVRVQV